MRRFFRFRFSVLVGIAFMQCVWADIVVSTSSEFTSAVEEIQSGETILVEDGVYADLKLKVSAKDVSIKALRAGKAVISGDSSVELDGDGIVFSGFYFKNGARDPVEWAPHGPGLVTVRGSRVRVTECAFHEFDTADGAWITVTPTDEGLVPMYVRIDHCSFTHKATFDQVVNLNNCDRKLWDQTYEKVDGAKGAPPMYHRLDHCYFSNPPKKGNAGGGIRVGTWRNDTGRCLIDNNVFERQDSEAEIITSKSRENIYFNNTYLNCQGTMNFRHGDKQFAIRNWFLGTDQKFGYGGMFVWGSDHAIVGNYFALPRTRKSRGEACIYLNAGVKGSEHARADDNLIANNFILADKGAIIDTSALLERRIPWAKENYGVTELAALLPRGNRLEWNFMAVRDSEYEVFRGNALEGLELMGNLLLRNEERQIELEGLELVSTRLSRDVYGLENLPDAFAQRSQVAIEVDDRSELPVDLNALIEGRAAPLSGATEVDLQGLMAQLRPLSFEDVGPSWLKDNPSRYAKSGVIDDRLKAMLAETQKRRVE